MPRDFPVNPPQAGADVVHRTGAGQRRRVAPPWSSNPRKGLRLMAAKKKGKKAGKKKAGKKKAKR